MGKDEYKFFKTLTKLELISRAVAGSDQIRSLQLSNEFHAKDKEKALARTREVLDLMEVKDKELDRLKLNSHLLIEIINAQALTLNRFKELLK